MAQRIDQDGPGRTKPILPSEVQNGIRKAAKKKGKHRSRGLHAETMTAGLAQDRINADALWLLDALAPMMRSAAPSANEILVSVLLRFMSAYTDVTERELKDSRMWRFDYALERATSGIDDTRLKAYFADKATPVNKQLSWSKRADQLVMAG